MANSKSDFEHILAASTWFAAMPLSERQWLLRHGEPVELQGGEMLYRKGDAANGFFGILQGTFKVSTLDTNGREGILAVLEAGHWVGETSLLDGLPRPHDVTALMPSRVLLITPAIFEQLMQRSGFARAMSSLLSSRVRALYGLIEDSMLRSTRARVARRLLSLARGDANAQAPARTSVQVSQEALAMMLGMTRQTLAKELKALTTERVLALGYGRIDILSLPDLERCGMVGD